MEKVNTTKCTVSGTLKHDPKLSVRIFKVTAIEDHKVKERSN